MSAWVANTGLMVMRNTLAVRFLLYACYTTRGKGVFEQDVANWLLLKQMRPQDLSWGLIDSNLVTASLDEIGAETVAFHAVGVIGTRQKAEVLERALEKLSSRTTGVDAIALGAPGPDPASGWCANRTRVRVPSSWRDGANVPSELVCS